MPLTNVEETKQHFIAAMDVDYLRVNLHAVRERLSMLETENRFHLMPMVATAATAPAPKAAVNETRKKKDDESAKGEEE